MLFAAALHPVFLLDLNNVWPSSTSADMCEYAFRVKRLMYFSLCLLWSCEISRAASNQTIPWLVVVTGEISETTEHILSPLSSVRVAPPYLVFQRTDADTPFVLWLLPLSVSSGTSLYCLLIIFHTVPTRAWSEGSKSKVSYVSMAPSPFSAGWAGREGWSSPCLSVSSELLDWLLGLPLCDVCQSSILLFPTLSQMQLPRHQGRRLSEHTHTLCLGEEICWVRGLSRTVCPWKLPGEVRLISVDWQVLGAIQTRFLRRLLKVI